ncbi:MAG: outer membrane lipoprotein carrier protein LolA [Bdellovibrionaceae bacterium]|nr:outer membrane lipoprotein carrier protein LolA [Pseudobdellovibrionaceae bacterium]
MKLYLYFSLFIFLGSHLAQAEVKAPGAPKTTELVLLKEVDQRYQKVKTIKSSIVKKDTVSALEQTREFEGTLWLTKGRFRLDVTSKDKNKDASLIVADGKTIWLVTPPPKEFKGAKTQVLKAPMDSKRARSQGLLQMLTEGGVLKYFRVTGTLDSDKNVTYFLQPDKQSLEFHRLQIAINKEKKWIEDLRYWDSMNNETEYVFSQIEFDSKFDNKLLTYSPPKDADIMNY